MDTPTFPETRSRVKSGPHIERKLNAASVRSAGPGRHYDGGGLYLQVDKSGARRWVLRVVVRGKRRDFGIGPAKYVSLAEAREKSYEYRKIARTGGNPQIKARADEGKSISFSELAKQVHERKFHNHRNNGKHVEQWIRTLETYAFPTLGNMSVSEILLDNLEDTLRPIWKTKAETARRVLQRISVVLDDACARGYRTNANPSVAARRSLGEQHDEAKNFAAMDYADIHHLMKKILASGQVGAAALGFTTLTAMRSGTVRDLLPETSLTLM
ncbi:Arm DNA-binding domain-containing protein [Celeribacter marinus]|uniref:tyrosine-type recombinase/integrase n=1 Tax=Celeribacter marinus TaxID=1397108 RepID=UPI00316C0D44